MATVQILFRNNDHLLTLTGLQDSSDLSFVNDATVTATVKDINGNDVTGIVWPLTLAYVAASNGNYEVVLDKAIVITPGIEYVTEITVVSGSRDAFFEVPTLGSKREE